MKFNIERIVRILIGVIIVVGLGFVLFYSTFGEAVYITEETLVEVDERDNIQKLSDNFAEAYREVREAEEAHAKTAETLSVKTEKYNEAVEYLQTYTK